LQGSECPAQAWESGRRNPFPSSMRLKRGHRPPRPSSGRILHQEGRLARRAWSDRLCAKAWITIPAQLRPGDLRLLSRLMQFPSLVITHRGAWVGVTGSDLDVPQVNAGVEHGRDKRYL
jgi:hypothetical protein